MYETLAFLVIENALLYLLSVILVNLVKAKLFCFLCMLVELLTALILSIVRFGDLPQLVHMKNLNTMWLSLMIIENSLRFIFFALNLRFFVLLLSS